VVLLSICKNYWISPRNSPKTLFSTSLAILHSQSTNRCCLPLYTTLAYPCAGDWVSESHCGRHSYRVFTITVEHGFAWCYAPVSWLSPSENVILITTELGQRNSVFNFMITVFQWSSAWIFWRSVTWRELSGVTSIAGTCVHCNMSLYFVLCRECNRKG